MTVHRAAWALRAAVVAVIGAGLLTVAATPAYADHDVRLAPVGNVEVQAGGSSQNVQILVENRDQPPHLENGVASVRITMTVPGGIGAVIQSAPPGCGLSANNTRMDCTVDIEPGQSFSGVAQIGANGNAPVEAGESADGVGEIVLDTGAQQRFNVKVNGPDEAPVVSEVSGIVTDQATGDPIDGARVVLVDGQGVEHQQTTDGNGNFRFTADDQIAPGNIGLRASKDGFEFGSPPTLTLGPEESEQDVRLVLVSTESPSPTPSASATPTATPTATASPTPVAAEPTSGGGFFTTLLIILGVLFVALGVGAIVLLVIRQRRRAREEEDGDGPEGAGGMPPGPPGPRPGPGSHGVYRPTPTQVVGAGNDQTQVIGPAGGLPAVGPRPALAHSPTMVQRAAGGPAADETAMLPRADAAPPMPAGPGSPTGMAAGPRSGAPIPPRPGVSSGAPTEPGAYGPGYGSPAAPGSGGGYRAEGAYSAYDQPTGRHERPGYPPERPGYPPERPGYPPERPGYPPERPGYPPERPRHGSEASSYGPDPYTQPAGPDTRYDPRGYESQGYESQGYESQGYESQNYDSRGYDSRGYDSRGHDSRGQDGRAGQERHGYDRGGYQDPGYADPGYADPGYADPGYGGDRGYEDPAYGDPRYGGRGYDDRGGYGSDAGYQQPDPRAADGYPEDPDARPRHSGPAERRRLDWLD